MKSFSLAAAATLLCLSASAFNCGSMDRRRVAGALQMSSEVDSRRDFLTKAGSVALSTAGLGVGVLAPAPANAVGGLDKVNAKLRGYETI